jgi:hypothetical protein
MKESKQTATSKKGNKTARRAAPKKSQAAEGVPAKDETASVTPEERYRMIAEVAYHKAERHSFAGDPVHYWVEAEAEIDKMLKEKKP